jgi:hypothetical protein
MFGAEAFKVGENRQGMHDLRLIGTWRSDARRTSSEIAARRDIPSSKKSTLRRLFGKLELRYSRTHCRSQLGTFVTVNRYTVVAKDSSSVAVVSEGPIAGKEIFHIHFEGDYYWVCLGSGRMREFFKRIK